MSGIGTWHNVNGYRFRETLHGPMVMGVCVDCADPALEVLPTGRINEHGLEEDTGGSAQTRCSTCGRAHHGAKLDYYGTGRAEAYGRRVSADPVALRVPTEGFFWRALHWGDPRETCTRCWLPMDPAARTVEHPNLHPSCVRYPVDAPMETPLGAEGAPH